MIFIISIVIIISSIRDRSTISRNVLDSLSSGILTEEQIILSTNTNIE